MSVHALAWVFDLPAGSATPTDRLVLLALADHANRDGGDIFPTNKRLCRMTGLSERAIRKTLRSLEERRLLRRAGTWHPEGRPDRARPRFSMPIEERGAARAPRQGVPPERGAARAPEPVTGTDEPTPPPSHPKEQPTATDTTAVSEALERDPPAEEDEDWLEEEEDYDPWAGPDLAEVEDPPPRPVGPLATPGKDLSRWRRA